MKKIRKRFVVDEEGNPQEVIILWEDFQRIQEILGLDLDETAIEDLRLAREEREEEREGAYVELDAI